MSTTIDDLELLRSLDTPVLEIVLDQARIAYRTQEVVKAANRAAFAEEQSQQTDTKETE